MAPSVQRARTAFQFYQAEKLREIKRELGSGTTMGAAMSELSARWKCMSAVGRTPFEEMEARDRERFQRESAVADARAAAEQRARRNMLVAQEGEDVSSRGARAKVENERAQEEALRRERRKKREREMDPEEREARRKAKAARKAEALERQRLREEEEKAVADRHKKLDKVESAKQAQRLDYLLKQSSIFAKLKMGHSEATEEEAKAKIEGAGAGAGEGARNGARNGVFSAHRKNRGAAKKSNDTFDDGEGEEVDDEQEQHVFLTKQPKCIKFGKLKPYQLEALNWMIHLAEKGLNGILADEMGLGKTVQSISILAYQYEYMNIQGPHLVCVPKSTLSNWMNELKRWCPALRAIRFHGNKEERTQLAERYFTKQAAAHDGKRPRVKRKNEETGEMEDDNRDNPREWDVCVTTYEVCNTEKKNLQKFAWKYLIIDEAHRLKNEASMFSTTVRSFSTAHRLLLTGTPLQNNLHELWALLNFLLPDIFSSAEQFDEWFNLEIDDEDAKKTMISQLHKVLRPFMLRRLKVEVAKGLPAKTETLVMVGMSKMQKQLYKKLLLRDIDSITSSSGGKSGKTAVLNIVMQLRKCCGHPYLFEGVEDRTLDPLGEHLVENCGKLSVVDKLLKKLKERGSRVLIFTQMTRILDILEDYLVMRGYKYCRIDGNTDYETRESSIDAFNREGSEKFCFILSTRAGGLGINLQTADTCILYDSDWNPQADLQAQDRCHRLGQKKPVNIYRMVTENTVEEKIVERAQQKLKLDAMVVQQGRLKEKDKVSKEEIMNAVRFGADAVFRSEESTITDEDIDAILERGKAKTKELADKLQKAEKGDLLDFRLDGGMSAQTFEGIDYSDKDLRNQLRLLAANSLGKRERKPLTNYNPIIAPKKTMIVNNRKIKLPRALRLPRMEDHHFYNRERLLALAKLEFETYAALREMGQLPSREYIDKAKTLLPPELAQEKLDLLNEGFGNWTRGQYFHFVKACTKYGRSDIASISADMDLPIELVQAYSEAFWNYGESELKKEEWERVKANVEKGEQKIAKRQKLSSLLGKFVNTFKNPREEMTFANKGTQHFALEQDRALLCAVNKHGYGNWESVREELLADPALRFSHTVQGMNIDAIAKRCDYRIRQMEKELELREKKLRSEKPAGVVAAEGSVRAVDEMERWEKDAIDHQLHGEQTEPLDSLSQEAQDFMEERLNERQQWIDRVREIEVQVRGCMALADETRKAILRGDQYVNYSNITLKAGGPHTMNSDNSGGGVNVAREVLVEKNINAAILRVPACGECSNCLDEHTRKLCVKRVGARNKLIMEESARVAKAGKDADLKTVGADVNKMSKKKKGQGKTYDNITSMNAVGNGGGKKVKSEKSVKKAPRPSFGENFRGNPLGNKKMAVPDELMPELCMKIGPQGTNERMKVITDFVKNHPATSIRQVTLKFQEIVTKTLPACVPPPEKRGGRAVSFYLRPRFYHFLREEERPTGWEKFAEEDEINWQKELHEKAMEKARKEQKMKDLMEEQTSKSMTSEADSLDISLGSSIMAAGLDDGDVTEDDEPIRKKQQDKRKKKRKKKE